MTDIIRLMIPLVAAILPSLGVLIASKFVTTKINYYKLEDAVTYRLKIVHKIAAVISYIFFVFIVYIYITLYLYAGLEFVTVWPIWIPLAIYIMIIIHINQRPTCMTFLLKLIECSDFIINTREFT